MEWDKKNKKTKSNTINNKNGTQIKNITTVAEN